MNKVLKIILISVGVLFIIGIVTLMYIGANSPETYIYTDKEIPKEYRQEIAELSLLEDDERIEFMYSDGLLNLTDGLYILTNKHIILYLAEWDKPEKIIDFSEITFVDVEYDDSFLTDSYITIETDLFRFDFPVSSEKGRDKEFYYSLQNKVEKAHRSEQ